MLPFDSFSDHFIKLQGPLLSAFGVLVVIATALHLFMFTQTGDRKFFMSALAGVLAYGLVLNCKTILDAFYPASSVPSTSSAGGSGLVWLAIGACVLACAVAVTRAIARAGRTVPHVSTKTSHAPDEGLQPQIRWMRSAELELPAAARATFRTILNHLEALDALVSPEAPVVSEMARTINDARDLVVLFKRYEASSKWLPGMEAKGVQLLLEGLKPVAHTLVETREALATERRNDLDVQKRFLEAKHADA